MLTEREVMDLGDRMVEHIGLMEKYRAYAQVCPDRAVRDVLTRQHQVLQSHYQIMAGFLQNAQNISGAAIPQTGWQTLS
ncbi:MAG: hypothetical protein ACOY31_11595 [Bacillota bacterium]